MFPPRSFGRVIGGGILVAAGLWVGTWLPPRLPSAWWDVLCSCGGFTAMVAGLLITVQAIAPKTSSRLLRTIFGVLIGAYAALYLLTIVSMSFSSGDWGHFEDLSQAAIRTNLIPQSVSQPNRPAVFCEIMRYGIFRNRYQVMLIYGVPRDAQDLILASIRSAQLRLSAEPVRVMFYERENWRTWHNEADGASGGSRGPETLDRVTVIH